MTKEQILDLIGKILMDFFNTEQGNRISRYMFQGLLTIVERKVEEAFDEKPIDK